MEDKMNTSTTSLVSHVSSSASFKPYVCAQPSQHTHAPQYKNRIHCTSPQSPSLLSLQPLRKLCHFKTPQPRIQDRERAVLKHKAQLEQREEKVRLREEMVEKRERSLKARFFELAQQKIQDACDAAAIKDEPRTQDGGRRRWKQVWKRKCGREGWTKWEEGRFG